MSSQEPVGSKTAGRVLPPEVDVLVVGAGFSGVAASVQLSRLGFDHLVIERADDVGGTWRDNRYPGCRCDVPIHLYSFSFAPSAEWTSSYAAQPEILAYLRRVAAEHGVYSRCHFDTELREAHFDEAAACWEVETSKGTVSARVLLAGFGPLSAPSVPPLQGLERRLYRHLPAAQRLIRLGSYWGRELFAYGLCKDPRRLETVRRLGLAHLASQVEDPALRGALTPDYTPGCKRITLSDDYYPALCAATVELVTSPIERVDASGLTTRDGRHRELDVIVLATGFQVTPHPVTARLHSGSGSSLADRWQTDGMQAYLGTTVAGFPNLFLLAGPNTGIGHTSLVFMVEAQLRYVTAALEAMRQRAAATIEVTEKAEARFVAGVARRLERTVWQTGHCTSWYLDEKGRATTLWPDFTWRFLLEARRFDPGSHRFSWARPGTVGTPPPVPSPQRRNPPGGDASPAVSSSGVLGELSPRDGPAVDLVGPVGEAERP